MEFVKAENIVGKFGDLEGGGGPADPHRLWRQADRLAAGLLELGLGGAGEFLGGDLERAADFAVAEDLEHRDARAHESGLGQHLGVHLGDLGVEPGEVADVDDGVAGAELVVVEAAVRELAVKGHLAALEAGADGAAGAGALALAAAGGGLAVAAAFAAADALLAVHGTVDVNESMETHFGIFLIWGAGLRKGSTTRSLSI